MGKVNSVSTFVGLFTVLDEYGEIRMQLLVPSKSHSCFRPSFDKMMESYWKYNSDMPQVAYTANVTADRNFLEGVIPSLTENVVHVRASQTELIIRNNPYSIYPVATIPVDVSVTVLETQQDKIQPVTIFWIWSAVQVKVYMLSSSPVSVALVQIYHGHSVYLLRTYTFNTVTFPEKLRQLIESPRINMVGRQISGDLRKFVQYNITNAPIPVDIALYASSADRAFPAALGYLRDVLLEDSAVANSDQLLYPGSQYLIGMEVVKVLIPGEPSFIISVNRANLLTASEHNYLLSLVQSDSPAPTDQDVDIPDSSTSLNKSPPVPSRVLKDALLADPKFIFDLVRRYIPPPDELYPMVKLVFDKYKNRLCSRSGLPLFADKAVATSNRILEEIRQGNVSDIVGGPALYTEIGVDQNGLMRYRCSRGTSSVEGSVHLNIIKKFASYNAGPRLTDAVLSDYRLYHNISVALHVMARFITGIFHHGYLRQLTLHVQTREIFGITKLPLELARKYEMQTLD
ncbi:hypothetical protein INT47_009933 [Mucor saturninus]|uniref:Uncharacterized protein n=1 Tax=Mucor saturninus TaxID=64648 RepID=A0A8H7UPJ7_9FUNG|nr:hypothetical protein INT47_009933 [Mucor saturninus]